MVPWWGWLVIGVVTLAVVLVVLMVAFAVHNWRSVRREMREPTSGWIYPRKKDPR